MSSKKVQHGGAGMSRNGELRQLPPSPNWYSASAMDWSISGIAAFAAKNTIKLFSPDTREIHGVLVGHQERVTSIEFCAITGEESWMQRIGSIKRV
jgi:hypothetical protein